MGKTATITNRKLAAVLKRSEERVGIGAKVVGRLSGTLMNQEALHVQGGTFQGPDKRYLMEYEGAYRNDPYIHASFDKLAQSMLASLGPYLHDDPRAVAYVNEMNRHMVGNKEQALAEHMIAGMWSGLAVSEMVLTAEKGRVWLRDLPVYHPASLEVVPDVRGSLDPKSKEKPAHPYLNKVGIWQRVNPNLWAMGVGRETQVSDFIYLPPQRLVHLSRGGRHGNKAGESMLAPVWSRLTAIYDTIRNLLITTERYGSPQVAWIVPKATTSVMKDDNSGYKSLAEVIAESVATLNISNGIVAEEPVGLPGDPKIRAQNISSFNNFAEAYHGSIKFMYRDLLVGLGIPPLLVLEEEGSMSGGTIARIQAEMYKQLVVVMYREFVEPFVEQVIGRLLYINFGIKDPGRFEFNPFDIAALETLMTVFAAAIEHGIIDPSIEEDLQMTRTRLGLPMASAATIPQRLKNNKELMAAIRRPDIDKVKVAEKRNEGALAVADKTHETQTTVAETAAKTTLKAAQLRTSLPKPKPPAKKAS